MSSLTRIILIGKPFVSEPQIVELNNWLYEVGELKQVSKYADGGRPYVEDVWMGCFNGLNLKEFSKALVTIGIECTLVVHREHDADYWLCQCAKEWLD